MRLVGGPRDGAIIELPANRDEVLHVPVMTPVTIWPEGIASEHGMEQADYKVGMDDKGEPVGIYVEGTHRVQYW